MPDRSTYRWDLLERLGGGGVYVTDGNGSTSTAICTKAFKSSVLPVDHLSYAWLYAGEVTAPRQRRITAAGLAGGTGTLTLDGLVGSDILSGQNIEISRHLPPVDDSSKTTGISLTQCLNLGLQDLESKDELQLSTVAGAYSISLATYAAWLNRESRLVDVLDPPLAAGYPPQSAAWRNPRLVVDGGTPRLDFDTAYAASGDVVTLRVIRPASTLISGAERTDNAGMTSDTATALPEVAELSMVALIYACKAIAALAESDVQRNHWLDRAAQAETDAKGLDHYRPRGGNTAAPAAAQAA